MAQSKAGVLTKPTVDRPVHFDVSPPLFELIEQAPPFKGVPRESEPLRIPHLAHLQALYHPGQAVTDPALQTYVGGPVGASTFLNFLGVGIGFPNYQDEGDNSNSNAAVGDTEVVQWVDPFYAVFDKSTGAILAGPIPGDTFWAGFGGPCENSVDYEGDNIIQWDKAAHRWLAAQNTRLSPYMTCIAVSQTSDALGSYYRFAYSDSGFPEYPKWGVFSNGVNNAYFYADNNFATGNPFLGAHPCAFQRDKLLTGDSTALRICFQTGTFDNSLLPADNDGTIPPPKGRDEFYMGSIDNGNPNDSNTVYLYIFHVDFTNPSNSTFSGVGGTMPITVAPFALACGGFAPCIPMPNSKYLLPSFGDRLMYRLAYRNVVPATVPKTAANAQHEVLLVTHSVTSTTGQVGVRWYEFRAITPSNPTVFQQGTFAPDTNYRWLGSIAEDNQGNITLGYSVSSSTVFPSIRYTGCTPSDPVGTMETEASIIEGTASPQETIGWSDFSSMAVDAADECTMWFSGQFFTVSGFAQWSTQLASLRWPNCP